MEDGTTVDSLQIEIEAASSEAAEKIQALTDALKGLQSATKGQFGDISRQIKSVGDAAGQTDGKSGRSKRKIKDEVSSPATQAKVSEIEQVTAKMAGLEEATQKAAESSGAVSSGIEEVASKSISVSTKIERLTSAWQSLKSVVSDTKNIANGGFTGGAEAGSKEAADAWAEIKEKIKGTTLSDVVGDVQSIDEAVWKMSELDDQVSLLQIKLDGLQEKLRGAFEKGNQSQISSYTEQIQKLKTQISSLQNETSAPTEAKTSETEQVESKTSLQSKLDILKDIKGVLNEIATKKIKSFVPKGAETSVKALGTAFEGLSKKIFGLAAAHPIAAAALIGIGYRVSSHWKRPEK